MTEGQPKELMHGWRSVGLFAILVAAAGCGSFRHAHPRAGDFIWVDNHGKKERAPILDSAAVAGLDRAYIATYYGADQGYFIFFKIAKNQPAPAVITLFALPSETCVVTWPQPRSSQGEVKVEELHDGDRTVRIRGGRCFISR